MTIKLTIPGQPQGKGRPKVTVRGAFAHAYTPKQTVIYENYIKVLYTSQCFERRLEGPIKAEVVCVFPIPKSTSKKKTKYMIENEVAFTKKPDIDNIVKAVLDSLNGLAYQDDSQVFELHLKKIYGELPRVELTLTEMENK